jgi:hypothetical protein
MLKAVEEKHIEVDLFSANVPQSMGPEQRLGCI